jgi:hypothetical protein
VCVSLILDLVLCLGYFFLNILSTGSVSIVWCIGTTPLGSCGLCYYLISWSEYSLEISPSWIPFAS